MDSAQLVPPNFAAIRLIRAVCCHRREPLATSPKPRRYSPGLAQDFDRTAVLLNVHLPLVDPSPSERPPMPSLLAREGDASPIVERLLRLLESEDYHPPHLPSTAVQLLELSRNPDVQPGSMVALLERDPLLAAELLRLAQSSQYGGSFSVRTLDEAIVRVGMRRIGELFLHAALEARVFRSPDYQRVMDELRRHSVAVAHLSRLVGRSAGVDDEAAFIAGLLHDVGIAASLIAVVETTPSGEKPPSFEAVWPAVARVHQYAGGLVASLWRFPSDVAFVIERHHDALVQGNTHPLVAVVGLADWVAGELGFAFATEHDPDGGAPLLDALGLRASEAQQLLADASRVLERVH